MKNGFFVALGLAIWGALKLIFKFLGKVIQLLTSLVLFLGLYIPLFYLLFGLILLAATDFTFGGTGTYQILYYVGLGLSCLASLIISVRNLLIKPFSSVFSAFRGKSKDRYDDEPDPEENARYDGERSGGRRGAYRDSEYYDRGRRSYGDYPSRDPDYAPRDDYAYATRGDYGYAPRDPYAPRDYDAEDDRYGAPARPPYPRSRYADTPRMREDGERPLVYYSQRRPGVLVEEYSDRFELYREDASGRTHIGTEYKED